MFTWYPVWTVVLLQYTHLLHSSMSVLNCVSLPVNGDTELVSPGCRRQSRVTFYGLIPPSCSQRWFLDGEVQCFTGGHLLLSLLAVAVLVFCIALIPLTLLLTLKDFSVSATLWFKY